MSNLIRWCAVIAAGMVASIAFAQRSTPVQLLHPSGAASDRFGQAVAIDGDTMIVGAPLDDVGANNDQGSAHIYRWTGSGWAFEATLTATGGAASDRFGVSVAISGNTALVGANGDNVGANTDQGSVYVFTRSGTTWTQQAQLTATGGAAGDIFGSSVAISGDTALVGAWLDDVGGSNNQGSASIFTRSGTTWTQQAQLTATGGAANDQFGYAVALSGDTALVGAYLDNVGANADQGSAYVFARSGSTWTQQAQLTAADGAASDWFGVAVAISGNTALVGAYLDNVGVNTDQGSAYVFTRSGTTWTQQAQLTATGGAFGDQFGVAVALSGDTALVGANSDDVGANGNQGSASVFTRSGSTWTQQAQLTASDGAASDGFGFAVALGGGAGDTALVGADLDDVGANTDQGSAWVYSRVGSMWVGPDLQLLASDGASSDQFGVSAAISGDTAIIGSWGDDIGINPNQGSAYVFVRSGSSWIQQAKLIASDGGASSTFGVSVAISGDTAIVGAQGTSLSPGSAYVFTRSGTTWTQQAKLTPSDGAVDDFFGSSVAIFGNTVIVGAVFSNVGPNVDQGSAYVFTRSGTTWTQQAKLTSSDGAPANYFGNAVALGSDTALVGARRVKVGANTDQGSAYVFTRSGTVWTQQAKLTASDGISGDSFGFSVALSGDSAIVGATFADRGANVDQGAAYIFTRSGSIWTQQAALVASDGAANDLFGVSVALSGDTAIVGASSDEIGPNVNQGSACVFTRSGTIWTQQSKLTASTGGASDSFGRSVGLSGGIALVGANFDDVGANADQGSASVFNLLADSFPLQDIPSARNNVTGAVYESVSAAMLAALSGHQISATEAAWRSDPAIDTLGKQLALQSDGDVRTPSITPVTLGSTLTTTLATPSSAVIDIFGPLNVPQDQRAVVSTDAFRLGSRGSLRLFQNAGLTINAPAVVLQAPVQVDAAATLAFGGDATTFANLIGAASAAFSSTGVLTNHAEWSLTSASVTAPTFDNRDTLKILGNTFIFGDVRNDVGATTTITSGVLLVYGSLTSNGSIIGDVCPMCPEELTFGVVGDLTLGTGANLLMPFAGAKVGAAGDYDSAINANTRYHMELATLQMEGTGTEQTLEVMSRDIGANDSGLDRTIAGHYPIGTLRIGPLPSTVRLVDAHDNDNLGQGSCEAIYVDTLQIDPGNRLINTACKIYYNTLINNGTIDFPANVIPLVAPCPGDLNGDSIVDDSDFVIFAEAYNLLDCVDPAMPAGCPADLNADLIVDDSDFVLFASAYDALLCP